jgi:type IV pilus assembly protein PilC
MATSRSFVKYWYVIPIVPIALIITLKLIRLNRSGAYILDKIKLKIPVAGMIIEKTIVARTMRTLGTLISSGVPILEALSIVRETAMNAVFEEMFQRVYESIREGETIANPMRECRLVDDMVVNMIDVGEETGDLDTMLNKIADVYDEEVDVLVESLISLLEPIMIVILGFIVGTIVIALFMPLLELLDGLSGTQSKRNQ